MKKCMKVAGLYIAVLKSISLIHQHNHWTNKSKSFYGNHLLFERLYKNTLEDLDLAAEKFIGLFGSECLDYNGQTAYLNFALNKYKDIVKDPIQMSLTVEQDFVKFCQDSYECFDKEGELTLGLDDMLSSISSRHEEACYLLGQVTSGE